MAFNALTRGVGEAQDYIWKGIAYGPEKAVDGDSSPDFWDGSCTHFDAPSVRNPWWLVDLGTVSQVYSINITNRLEDSQRLRNFTVEMSQNLQAEATLLDRSLCFHYHPGEMGSAATVNFPCPGPVYARYVKVQLHLESETFTLCEVQVWGIPPVEPFPVCPSYTAVPGRKFPAMVLTTVTKPSAPHCAIICHRTKHCYSFNLKTETDGFTCELLEDIHELRESDVIDESNWHYFRTMTP